MKIAVCDTGPIFHLREADLLYLLAKIGKVYIPKMVDRELEKIDIAWKDQKPSWISVEALSEVESSKAEVLYSSGVLDAGESEAVILAQRIKVNWLLTDDTTSRIFANTLGIEVHGSLGIVLWAAVVGHLQYADAKSAIDKLAQSSLWISKTILDAAYKALDEIFG